MLNRPARPIRIAAWADAFHAAALETLFRDTPELLLHAGSTGAFAFYASHEKLYPAGTFNQYDKPLRPFNFMRKAADNV